METFTVLLLLTAICGGVVCTTSSGPLYLTPYIESGQVALGKAKACVTYGDLLLKGIESYSGYFTVNQTYNSNLFFWYFPAKNNAANAPVVLWLQGGPGASSLYGLFMENGPVFVNAQNRLEKRQHSWHLDHHVVYIDNPGNFAIYAQRWANATNSRFTGNFSFFPPIQLKSVGAGFSFTDNPAGYAKSQADVGPNLFSAVRQFFKLFPEIRNNRFYIAGESYAGKYVPTLGHEIYARRESDFINLKGIAIGNGVTDPVHQILYGDYFYQLGFIDKNALATFNQYQNAALSYIAQGNYYQALLYTFSLINTPTCLFNNLTGYTSPYNSLQPDGYNPLIERVGSYLVNSGIANHLHVGSRTFVEFTDTNPVLSNLVNDILDSVAPYVAELADNYKVFIYNGQLDLLVSATLTENYLNYLTYSGAAEFQSAKRNIWRVNNEIAGYYKKGGNLTHITVRAAGHMVPVDQPEWAYNLLKRLTFETGF